MVRTKILADVIKRLNIRLVRCKSGTGLMSYTYSFIQIGGFMGQSNDNPERMSEELWDGDYTKGDVVLDCRKGDCLRISKLDLADIIEAELTNEPSQNETNKIWRVHYYRDKELTTLDSIDIEAETLFELNELLETKYLYMYQYLSIVRIDTLFED